MSNVRCSSSGFTLIELLVVVGVVAALTGVVFLELTRYRGSQNLRLTLNEVAAEIRETQARSVTQESGVGWGMRFVNSGAAPHFYEVFRGESYATSAVDRKRGLKRNVIFSEPGDNLHADIAFRPISGRLLSAKIISLISRGGEGIVGDIILNRLGIITTRFETGLEGYWHFDEGNGTSTYDVSGNRNTGVVGGALWQAEASCRAGRCLSFDGGDDYVLVDNVSALNFGAESFSVSVWFYDDPSSGSEDRTMLNKKPRGGLDPGWMLRLNDEKRVSFSIADGSTRRNVESEVVTEGVWHQAVAVIDKDRDQVVLYLNGSLANSRPSVGSLNNDLDLRIGISEEGRWPWFGMLDEIRIYDRALSASEIETLYNDLK